MLTQTTLAAAVFLALFGKHRIFKFFLNLGLVGLVPISVVDSSFVPLPIPGVTDIMVIVYCANHVNVFLIVFLATLGSAGGGLFSYTVGHAGGRAFLEKHVPALLLTRVTTWMESHAILAVAVPAILPPPVPLSPFVLVAGASNMSRQKFMTAFTISRLARHIIAAWLGIHYGRGVLALWSRLSSRYGVAVLVAFWIIIIAFTGIGIWKLYRTSKEMDIKPATRVRRRVKAAVRRHRSLSQHGE